MKKKWLPIGVAVFAIVDIVLIYLAVRHTSGPSASADAGPAATTVDSSATETTEPTSGAPSTAPTSSAGPAAASDAVSLVALATDGTVLQASSGQCEPGVTSGLQLSTDGGATFAALPAQEQQVLRVIATSKSNLQYVGADEDCETALYQSVDGGTTWSKGPADGSWHLAAGPPSTSIVSPEGETDAGCVPVGISVLSKTAAFVACADGGVRGTADGGETWNPAGAPQGIVNVSFLNQTNGYALAVAQECPAEVRRTSDGGKTWNPVGCIQGSVPQSVDAIGQRVVAVVDGTFHTSVDGGVTWN